LLRRLVALTLTVALAACSSETAAATRHPTSSIDRRVQRAAEAALVGVTQPADLVALRASTGEILAFVGPDPLVGRYPTGSVFKIVTAAALLEHGLTLASPASCPASIAVDGRTLANFDGLAHPISDLEQAFVHSCNTAFAQLGLRLPDTSFRAAAAELGLGLEPHLGRPAFGGTVAIPASSYDRADVASDGGATAVSPLALATVAATVASGHRHRPHLTAGAAEGSAPAPPRAVIAGLRQMMAGAVATGTASGQGLPAGTHAKTGTARRASDPPPRTIYAWLVGYRGDVAFAVLVVGGADGGSVAGPIAARFLAAIER
jgi:cell division protein FtsI/penicillin-binding protein 2